jgi:hypothetical protein
MMKRMTILMLICSLTCFYSCSGNKDTATGKLPGNITISAHALKDKIMGGWAGQTIGVTFGGPYEFRFNGTFIQNYEPLMWHDNYLKETMINIPGLYDDIYMDLTFVEVFHRLGLDAPVDSFAEAFAHAGYKLWHANQAARYNILHGMRPPQSGYWMNNPHADDIDYQIESDFSGLMSPGMPNAAAAISDKIGHIMNYGDGWYGGVYVGAMYTMAFVSDDVRFIVNEALKMIPEKSEFHQCIADVIKWHQQYPNDWHQTWFNLQKTWSSDIGCPKGVFNAFDIDAKINAAYVTMGLLYGKGDYGKSLEIATRAGQDADCNPSTVGGILGTMLGYEKIPARWKTGLKDIEDIDFKYTTMSLNKVYDIGYNQALEMIRRHGGVVKDNKVTIVVQKPVPVRYEKSFEGMFPVAKVKFKRKITDTAGFSFQGTGFALLGEADKKNSRMPDYVLKADLYLDGEKIETVSLPTSFTTRRFDLFWKYRLPDQKHQVKIVIKNPRKGYELRSTDYVLYQDKPANTMEE